MAKFPQVEWMEIDGQLVPSTKPQHYKKGSTTETELTGHDNPLPTADYGMTKGGIWIPKRVDDDGNTLTQLTGSNVVLQHTIADAHVDGFRIGRVGMTGLRTNVYPVVKKDYKKIGFVVKNNLNVEVKNLTIVFYYTETERVGIDTTYFCSQVETQLSVPSGAVQTISPSDYAGLDNPSLSCILQFDNPSYGDTTGELEVIFLGGN